MLRAIWYLFCMLGGALVVTIILAVLHILTWWIPVIILGASILIGLLILYIFSKMAI